MPKIHKRAKPGKSSLRKNLLLLLVTIAVAFLALEIFFRVYYAATHRVIGKDYEEVCSRTQLRKTLNPSDPRRYLPLDTSYLQYNNITGVMPMPNLSVNPQMEVSDDNGTRYMLTFYSYNTNSAGMRGLRDFNLTKTPGRTRIALLGDSFTWGADVPLRLSYAGILEDLVPGSEVLNFGIEGVGTDIMYLRWKYEAQEYNPDIVIMTVFIEDLERVRPCIYKPGLKAEGGKIVVSNMPPPRLEDLQRVYREPAAESYLIKHVLYTIDLRKDLYRMGLDLMDPMLDEMKQRSGETGTYFMVAIIDSGNDYVNSRQETGALKEFRAMLDKKGIPYVDSGDIFREAMYTPTDRFKISAHHFDPVGYAIFAQGIRERLEQDKAIPPGSDYYFSLNPDSQILALKDKKSSEIRYIIPYDVVPE